MTAKRVTFGATARERVLSGAGRLADAIRVTLGPRSKSVLMRRDWGPPLVCNDGVTVAKAFELEDAEEDLGARMLRQAAERTAEAVGDGTSTATVLAYAILADGVRNVAAGASAVDLKRGLDRAAAAAVEALRAQARPVSSRREKAQVAALSAHNDPAIGELVAEALERIGNDGLITAEDSKSTATTLDVVEGMQFDRGYLSPYFVNQPEKMEAVLENAMVLVADRRLSVLKDAIGVLDAVAKAGRPLLVVAEEVEGDVLAALVVNQVGGTLRSCAVKAPGFGDRRKALLGDIAALTGATVVSDELGMRLESVGPAQLGHAKRVVVSKDTTTIVEGGGTPQRIAERRRQIEAELGQASSDYDRDRLRERLASLSAGVAVIRVGAASEAEIRTKRDALDDAIAATRAAVAEGIVPGGGAALLRCAAALGPLEAGAEGDERTGVSILRRALEAPCRQIAENSAVDGGVVVARTLEAAPGFGFDAARKRYVDLYEAGIVDPAKVLRVALENAVSAAGVLLLTEATMTDVPAPRGTGAPAGAEA